MVEQIIITKEQYFSTWTEKDLVSVGQEQKDEIFEFFINRQKSSERDNYMCQNKYCVQEYNEMLLEERQKYMECHHLVARRDFKLKPTLPKLLGYNVHDLLNLTTLCKACHKGYERAKLTLLINGQEYRLIKPTSIDMKKIIKDGKEIRKALNKLQKGWGNLSEDDRMTIIYLLMKWLSVDMVHEMND